MSFKEIGGTQVIEASISNGFKFEFPFNDYGKIKRFSKVKFYFGASKNEQKQGYHTMPKEYGEVRNFRLKRL